jgi:GNAT superfamily N-acetyltransferase
MSLPSGRGEGISTALIAAACDWARAAGRHDVEVVVTPHGRDVAGLVPYYEKQGFENTERIIMERAL